MEGVFESDRARLRPPPSFLTKQIGSAPPSAKPSANAGGPSGGAPASSPLTGLRSNPIKRPQPSISPAPTGTTTGSPVGHPGGSPSAFGGSPAPQRDYAAVSAPRFGKANDHSTPISRATPNEDFRSVPVQYKRPNGNHVERHEDPSHDYSEADLHLSRGRISQTSLNEEQQRATVRSQSSKRRAPAKPAAKSSVRAKSPVPDKVARTRVGPTGQAARGPAAGGPSARGAKRRPTELEQAKDQIEKMSSVIETQRMDIADMEDRLEQQQRIYEADMHAQHEEAQAALDQMGQDMDDLERQKNSQIADLEHQVQMQISETQRAEQKVVEAKDELEKQKQSMLVRIQKITDEANERMDAYEKIINQYQDEMQRLEGVVQERDETIRTIEQERDDRYQQYEEYLMVGEKSRAELHNALIEMKGNIRVFARVRPMLEAEAQAKMGDRSTHFRFPEGTDHRMLQLAEVPGHQSVMGGKSEPNKTLSFQFDKVFGPETTQSRVFDEISQLVQSSLDGYKVTIFAYGQTGSGKTFTMEGPSPSTEGEGTGMIARAVNQIFENTQWKSKQTGFRFKLICSFVEIYNEAVHDLLDPKGLTPQGTATVKHEIRIQDGEAVVTNIHEEVVEDKHHVYELLRIANENRSTAGTKMNERASRSHSVFMMKIKGYNDATRQEISGLLNLVDLAGSERLSKSQAEGDRLRETQHINKSLACLGDVIAALAKGNGAHVPFRQSKLTHLLQPSMTNESKTLMFVNLNPVKDHLHESVCSLRFAAKVNACEIGLARRKVKQND